MHFVAKKFLTMKSLICLSIILIISGFLLTYSTISVIIFKDMDRKTVEAATRNLVSSSISLSSTRI